MKNRSILNSPRISELKKKRNKILRNKILFLFFGILIIFLISIFLSRISIANINEIKISGNKIIDEKDIRQVVEDNISGYYLYSFPKTNFFLYPKKKIKDELENKFKRFSMVSIKLRDFEILEILVEERDAQYIYCGEKINIEINSSYDVLNSEISKCYFMDSDGYIFDEAPYFSGEVYFKFYGHIKDKIDSPVGFYFAPDIFKNILSFKNQIEKMDMKVVSFLFKNDGDIEFNLSKKSNLGNSPKIILKKDFISEKAAENLQAVLFTDPLKSDFLNKYSSLLYIDLRFGNKVYFKFE